MKLKWRSGKEKKGESPENSITCESYDKIFNIIQNETTKDLKEHEFFIIDSWGFYSIKVEAFPKK